MDQHHALAVSDCIIFVSYFLIPAELLFFSKYLSNASCRQWLLLILFVMFIALCGLTHLVSMWQFYGLTALTLKIMTAAVSALTSVSMLWVVPSIIRMQRENSDVKRLLRFTNGIRFVLKRDAILRSAQLILSQEWPDLCVVHIGTRSDANLASSHIELNPYNVTAVLIKEAVVGSETNRVSTAQDVLVNIEALQNVSDRDQAFSTTATDNWLPDAPASTAPDPQAGSTTISAVRADEQQDAATDLCLFVRKGATESDRWLWIRAVVAQIELTLQHAALLAAAQKRSKQLEHQNKLLQQTQESERRLLSAKGELLEILSHEIRTPLTAVITMSELLASSHSLEDEEHEYADIIQRSGKLVLQLINNILDNSKLEAGKFVIESIWFDLDLFVSDTAALFRPGFEGKKLTLRVEKYYEKGTLIRGDPLRLAQICNNLLSNAQKFTQHGQVTLVVKLVPQRRHVDSIDPVTRRSQDRISSGGVTQEHSVLTGSHDETEHVAGDEKASPSTSFLSTAGKSDDTAPSMQLIVAVRDTGIGIEAAKIKSLFNRYSQLQPETARLYGGSGLGLSICSMLAKLMHGKIQVQSAVGVGSTFTFSVPIQSQFRQLASSSSAAAASSLILSPAYAASVLDKQAPLLKKHDVRRTVAAEASRQTSSKDHVGSATQVQKATQVEKATRILLADDNMINRICFIKMLNKLGYSNIAIAEDGAEALRLYQDSIHNNQRFDVLLLDDIMPALNGSDVCREIRKTDSKQIIILSSAKPMDHQSNCGANDTLAKPYTLEMLRQKMQHWT